MFVLAENAQAGSLLTTGGTQWNMFLFSGTPPADKEDLTFALTDMKQVYNNSVAGLRMLAVNNATYGWELLGFDYVGTLFVTKQHGERSVNGLNGIQLIPQSIDTNIAGLEKPAGFVNGLESLALAQATATTHIVTDNWIEYDFGTECSVNRVLFGNMSATTRNATSMNIEYWDGSAWQVAAAAVAVKTYNATGIETTFAPIVARRWRVRFLNNTGTIVGNTLQYMFLRFFANVMPAEVFDRSNTVFTWAIVVPAAPTVATYEPLFPADVPAIIVTAGGPTDGSVATLNRNKAGLDDIISLVNLKIKGTVAQETV